MKKLRIAPASPTPPGLWRRMPPAVFPSILGLAGLALAWRGAVAALNVPPALPEALAGAVAALTAFALIAYATKLARRPSVARDEAQTLPGRAGMAAGVLSLYLLAALIAPFSLTFGRVVLVLGLGVHLALLAVVVPLITSGPEERRRVTPVWHLIFAGFLVAARAALPLGWPGLAVVLFWPAAAAAVAIWGFSLAQFLRESVPPPLRPLMAIHLAPVALIGAVAAGIGLPGLAWACGWVTLAALALIAARAQWLLVAGFTPFWGALTFPLAASAGLWVTLGAAAGIARIIAVVVLVAATLIVLPIAGAVLRLWSKGELAVKTNAASA